LENKPPSKEVIEKLEKLFRPKLDKPYPEGILHLIYRKSTHRETL
jgi:hypothetical protein